MSLAMRNMSPALADLNLDKIAGRLVGAPGIAVVASESDGFSSQIDVNVSGRLYRVSVRRLEDILDDEPALPFGDGTCGWDFRPHPHRSVSLDSAAPDIDEAIGEFSTYVAVDGAASGGVILDMDELLTPVEAID